MISQHGVGLVNDLEKTFVTLFSTIPQLLDFAFQPKFIHGTIHTNISLIALAILHATSDKQTTLLFVSLNCLQIIYRFYNK